jgi:hypothetical protein
MNLKHMTSSITRSALGGLVVLATLAGCEPRSAGEETTGVTTWYVQSTLEPTSTGPRSGTQNAPFFTLAEVEAASASGDEIRILPPTPGAPPLDGGISLKSGQHLRGIESVDSPPQITNTDPARRGGDAVTLADDSKVSGLHILGAAGHAVVGRNVSGAVVTGNWIHAGNLSDLTSVGTGATAGLGIPKFPKGIVAFIHDGINTTARPNIISDNEITGIRAPGQALTRLGGAGIALHARGNSQASLLTSENRISDLGPGFQRSGILIDAQGDAKIDLEIDDTSIANAFGSSDGIILVAQHRSSVTASVRRYHYVGGTPDQGLGNNGLEVATYYGADWLTGGSRPERHSAQTKLLVEESDIEGAGGFGVVVFNIFGKPSSATVLDFGGGELGGRGANRIQNNGLELPSPLEVYVVQHDLNMANNWWGVDRTGSAKVEERDGGWQLKSDFAFNCPGEPDQLRSLVEGTGTTAWSMFCQTYHSDVCIAGDDSPDCCDPSTDSTQCKISPADSSLASNPALPKDPRP